MTASRRFPFANMVHYAIPVIVIASLALAINAYTRHQAIVVRIDENQPITDREALEISEEALQQSGLLAPELKPVFFRQDQYFARNVYDENDGYVMWNWEGDPSKGCTVYIKRRRGFVECSVVAVK